MLVQRATVCKWPLSRRSIGGVRPQPNICQGRKGAAVVLEAGVSLMGPRYRLKCGKADAHAVRFAGAVFSAFHPSVSVIAVFHDNGVVAAPGCF